MDYSVKIQAESVHKYNETKIVMKAISILFILLITLITFQTSSADDGYNLWLNYFKVSNPQLSKYQKQITEVLIAGDSPTIKLVRGEIQTGLKGMLGSNVPEVSSFAVGL